MKKVVFLTSLCALALSAGAQIKVQSNGNIAIHTTSTASSPISINCQGNSSNYLTCVAEGKNGTYVAALGNSSSTANRCHCQYRKRGNQLKKLIFKNMYHYFSNFASIKFK